MKSHLNRGTLKNLTNNDLSWHEHKLFLEYSLDPNYLDW